MATNKSKMTKAQRLAAARAEAERIKIAQKKREKRIRLFTISGAVLVLALIAVAVTVIIQQSSKTELDQVSSAPANSTEKGGYSFGESKVAGTQNDGAVTVTVYSDYMCPGCGQFEKYYHETIDNLLASGDITLDIQPLANLDRMSQGTEYSTRTTNDVAVVANGAPDKVLDFHEALFANQPEENSSGLTDDQIASIAKQVGVPQSVIDEFKAKPYADWVTAATDQAYQDGIESTPTVQINGKDWTIPGSNPQALVKAVQNAKDGKDPNDGMDQVPATPTATTTPSPSATPSADDKK